MHFLSLSLFIFTLLLAATFQKLSTLAYALLNLLPQTVNRWPESILPLIPSLPVSSPAKWTISSFPRKTKNLIKQYNNVCSVWVEVNLCRFLFIVYGQCLHFLGKQKYIEQYNNVWSVWVEVNLCRFLFIVYGQCLHFLEKQKYIEQYD